LNLFGEIKVGVVLVQLDTEHKRQVEEITSAMECPKDFICYKSGFENLSKVNIIGDAKLVECLNTKANTCRYSFSFVSGYFCKCPLRYYIAKNFHE